MKTNVYVLYGGKSTEHEVSIKSAHFIINSLNKDKYNIYPIYINNDGKWFHLDKVTSNIEKESELISNIDTFKPTDLFISDSKNIVFPALHGTFGEDGTIQGLLEMFNVPYIGNGVLASSISIDKCIMRELCKNDIPQPKYYILKSYDWKKDENISTIKDHISLPCYTKPARLGSSVGISRCDTNYELIEGINKAFKFDDKIIIEEEINGKEMQVLVIGNNEPIASEVGEISQNTPFLDYEIKYTDGLLSHIIPARISDDLTNNLKEMTIKIFKKLNCSGLLRVDYFISDNNRIYLNEVNTMPGFTKVSMVPDLWRATYNTKCDEFIDLLIKLGFERHENSSKHLYKRS